MQLQHYYVDTMLMKLAVENCPNLNAPALLVETRMRKMMACVCQLMTLDRADINEVLNHMGHTFDVHRDYYQHYSTIAKRLDIAKLLLIQDQNRHRMVAPSNL